MMLKFLKLMQLIALSYVSSTFALTPSEVDQLEILTRGNNLTSIKSTAAGVYRYAHVDTEITDVMAEIMFQNCTKSEYADTLGWIAKALGATRNPRYKKILKVVMENNNNNGNLNKHIKIALKLLPDSNIAPYEAGTIDLVAEQRRSIELRQAIDEDRRARQEAREKQERAEKEARDKELAAEEQRFQTTLNSLNPKLMYTQAGSYILKGENLRGNKLYTAIIQHFPTSDWAVKAQDQMTENRRADVIAASNEKLTQSVRSAEESIDYKKDAIESELRQIESERRNIEYERSKLEDVQNEMKKERKRREKEKRESDK